MKAKKFTLIELLMVIAVIAILASLLYPSFNRARALSQRVVCMSNLKQLHNLVAIYTSNQKGNLPVTYAATTYGEECSYSGSGYRGLGLLTDRYLERKQLSRLFVCPASSTLMWGKFDIQIGAYSSKGGMHGQGPLQYRTYNANGQMTLSDSSQAIISDLFAADYFTSAWYTDNGVKDISHGVKGCSGYGVIYKDGHARLHNDPSRAISQLAGGHMYYNTAGWTYFDANP